MSINVADVIQSDWFKDPSKSSIWARAYRVVGISLDEVEKECQVIEMSNASIVLIKGKLQYLKMNERELGEEPSVLNFFKSLEVKNQVTPEGIYLLIILPHTIDGNEVPEPEIKFKIDTIAGLLSLFYGRNIVYEEIYESIFNMDGRRQVYSPVFLSPFWNPKPILDESTSSFLGEIDSKIEGLDGPKKQRVLLGLRWFKAGIFDSGIDAFLKYWIVLETLAMPDTSNVKPLRNILASIYNISKGEASEKYKIGLIHGFRSKIVHDGYIGPIHATFLRYMEALICDVLLYVIDGPKLKKTEQIFEIPGFDVCKYIDI